MAQPPFQLRPPAAPADPDPLIAARLKAEPNEVPSLRMMISERTRASISYKTSGGARDKGVSIRGVKALTCLRGRLC